MQLQTGIRIAVLNSIGERFPDYWRAQRQTSSECFDLLEDSDGLVLVRRRPSTGEEVDVLATLEFKNILSGKFQP